MNHCTMRQLPIDERPRERLIQHGPDVMSTAELIAIILGNGTKGISVLQLAQDLTHRFGSDLADATVQELCEVRGMGKAKAVQLKAALSLGTRVAKGKRAPKKRIVTAKDVYDLINDEIKYEKREFLIAILLDTKGRVICRKVVTIGTLNQTLVHSREVFYDAIRHKAASIILAHNHPSGDPTPSKGDRNVTKNLISVGKMMGIPVYDHVIIGDDTYFSLREEGIEFK